MSRAPWRWTTPGKIWVGGNADFGYLAPDAAGTLQFVSILDKVPVEHRGFTSVWQTLSTPQGVFFHSYQRLFRWDGARMQVWVPPAIFPFQALSAIRGHVYTAQTGTGLEEIVGDQLHNMPAATPTNPIESCTFTLGRRPHSGFRARSTAHFVRRAKGHAFPTQADDYLRTHKIYTSTVLTDGSICITTLMAARSSLLTMASSSRSSMKPRACRLWHALCLSG